METTYTMIGSDGQQYGPVALAQVKNWIGEGRIGPETKVLRSDTQSWLAAAQYVELGLSQPLAAPPPASVRAPEVSAADPRLERRVRSGSRWFFWIAGLSLVNTIMVTSGQGTVFLTGLAVSLYIYAFAVQLGSAGPGIGIAMSVAVSALFAVFGIFARKGHSWSFIAGMVLYALDALLAIRAGVGAMAAFHAFVLVWLFLGLKANLQLKAQAVKMPG
jgi:hypothetical protein